MNKKYYDKIYTEKRVFPLGKRVKYLATKKCYVILSIIIAPILTILFATIESPFIYSMSNIGYHFNVGYTLSFIIWGIVTALCVTVYILYTFTKANFSNKKAMTYLILSDISIILTVLTPAIKEVFPFLHVLHMIYSIATPIFLIAAILLFMNFLTSENHTLPNYLILALIAPVLIPTLCMFFIGFNGFIELLFILLICILLVITNIFINSKSKPT